MTGLLRRTLIIVAAVLGLNALPTVSAHAEPYVFDRGHTLIAFSWSHLGMTRQQGRINGYDGTIDIDPAAPEAAKLDITMRVNSLDTGLDTLDRTLRSFDYFDAATFPNITFKSTAIQRTGEKTADVTGDLTIRGITKPITLAVSMTFLGDHPLATMSPVYNGKRAIAFSAKGTLKRSDFGVDRGTPLISDEIEIAIETELLSRN